MENTIFDGRFDETIGFFDDMKRGLKKQACEFVESGDFEQAGDLTEILTELEKFSDFEGLIVLSDNNGMGWTLEKYSEWAKNNDFVI